MPVPALRTPLDKDFLSTCHVPVPAEALLILRLRNTTYSGGHSETQCDIMRHRDKHTETSTKHQESQQDVPTGLRKDEERLYPEDDLLIEC